MNICSSSLCFTFRRSRRTQKYAAVKVRAVKGRVTDSQRLNAIDENEPENESDSTAVLET